MQIMIHQLPRRRRADPLGTPLLRLFHTALAPQLLPRGDEKGVMSIDSGACVWLPDAKLAITTVGAESPIEGYGHAQAAELSGVDILAIDFDPAGALVACELALFGMHRAEKFLVARLALWISPHGLAALVPVSPRNAVDRLPPCFALTPTGVRFLADPFFDAEEWQAGITRAVVATGRAPLLQPSRQKPKLRLVR
ncbi:hypothetical protein [Glacieibacterium frigidum]|uniref:Uncharacterized protein n=1 Tax=Glacieibacterium frigidum TaxID=2593303 RepID=A0A552U8F3_9SPHN|nr:hypothetical protein [Glacieibacterium frigidum]TRW14491.1 hypothetical protein FMM06_12355 [Glacieibacterium frigidum]